MSMIAADHRIRDLPDGVRGTASVKCRIPQRLPPSKPTCPPAPRPMSNNNKFKGASVTDTAKQKFEAAIAQQSRFTAKNTRAKFDETRPKSANRIKDELFTGKNLHSPIRPPRPGNIPAPKRQSALSRRTLYDSTAAVHKGPKHFITVPLTQGQKAPAKTAHLVKNQPDLPDQETIKRCEDLELSASVDALHSYNELNDESITSRSDRVMQLKIAWQEKLVQYEKLKNELNDRQKAILQLYASMRTTHTKITSLGEKKFLPSAEDLRIMNVCKLTPEQLLHLCSEFKNLGDGQELDSAKTCVAIDLNKLYSLPQKLVNACEQTLLKRKEIIDWFEALKSQEKGIPISKLSKKLNEFNAENEMLKCGLDKIKCEFLKELEGIINTMRKSAHEMMALHLRTDELTSQLAELNSQNSDYRKMIQNADNSRSYTNKIRVEELERDLKEEKCKRMFMKNQLTRAEGQVKINMDRANQLEAALEQSRSQAWALERTVQQLHDQNQKLQNDFDKELNKLTESIREHTVHLEEIAEAREKLQLEKEELEKKITELSEFYNKSIRNTKHDLQLNVAKLVETEEKYKQDVEDKKKLEAQVESLCAQLLENELRLKDTVKQLEENNNQRSELQEIRKDLENARVELEACHSEIEEYRNILTKQSDTIKDVEKKITKSISLEQSLKNELLTKDEYISELEKKQSLLEQQLQENENKMEAYVTQMSSLKNHINQLQEDFGDFQNINELHEMVNKQRAQLLEATRENRDLAEALQKKDEELERFSNNLAEQEHSLEQRERIIKMFSEKEEEQTNIIKILRNNLELRSQADNDLNQQVMEKNAEIESLIANVETRKQQISNLEKIVLTLEDQTRKANVQKKRDQDKLAMMQKKLAEYEQYHLDFSRAMDTPADNLDNLIKKLEDELCAPLEPQLSKENHFSVHKKKYGGDRKRDHDIHEGENTPMYRTQNEAFPTKIVMGNFVKKTYIPSNEEQFQGDNLDRKKAITSMETQRWNSPNTGPNTAQYGPLPSPTRDTKINQTANILSKAPFFSRNLIIPPNQLRDERKYKMFKIAGHKL